MKKIKCTKTTKQITDGIDHGPPLDAYGGVLMCDMVGMGISEAGFPAAKIKYPETNLPSAEIDTVCLIASDREAHETQQNSPVILPTNPSVEADTPEPIVVIKSDMSPVEIHPEVGVLSINEFAVWAGICRSKVYKEIVAERLVADKVGRRTVIWKSEAERWRADLPKFVGRRPQPMQVPGVVGDQAQALIKIGEFKGRPMLPGAEDRPGATGQCREQHRSQAGHRQGEHPPPSAGSPASEGPANPEPPTGVAGWARHSEPPEEQSHW